MLRAGPPCPDLSGVDDRSSWAAPLAISPLDGAACGHPAASRGCISAVVRRIFWAKPLLQEKTRTYGARGTVHCHSPTPIRHRNDPGSARRGARREGTAVTCAPVRTHASVEPHLSDLWTTRRPSIGCSLRMGHASIGEPAATDAPSSQQAMRPQVVGRVNPRIAAPMWRAGATREGVIESGEAILPLPPRTTPSHTTRRNYLDRPRVLRFLREGSAVRFVGSLHGSRIRTRGAPPGRDGHDGNIWWVCRRTPRSVRRTLSRTRRRDADTQAKARRLDRIRVLTTSSETLVEDPAAPGTGSGRRRPTCER